MSIPAPALTETAYFAGGCFWCTEAVFVNVEGVAQVTSGYLGGPAETANYQDVCSGKSRHYEGVRVIFDPGKVSYQHLLDIFWQNIDPFDGGGQFADRGSQYHTAIFTTSEAQRRAAELSKAQLGHVLGQRIATKILPAFPFYPAEEYHQDYSKKNPLRYMAYHHGSGRPQRLAEVWGEDDPVTEKAR
jgi:methionine-S-sulfoxide reductase